MSIPDRTKKYKRYIAKINILDCPILHNQQPKIPADISKFVQLHGHACKTLHSY